ncbi:hypothetical protein EBB07_04330 [Paenibacillaceae bacterium]|nr:hypothetical protein EBB07_04330 [Paenibacillaceae bacterium]
MSEEQQKQAVETDNEEVKAPRKVSLAEAMKQKLEQKKREQAEAKKSPKHQGGGSAQVMRSQHTKKVNNQRKKMGV